MFFATVKLLNVTCRTLKGHTIRQIVKRVKMSPSQSALKVKPTTPTTVKSPLGLDKEK